MAAGVSRGSPCQAGSLLRMPARVSAISWPSPLDEARAEPELAEGSNGRCPASISNRTTPKAQMSRAPVRRASLRLLRAHVSRRAENHPDAGHHRGGGNRGRVRQRRSRARRRRLHRLGQTEVEHLHRAVRTDLDVRGLEIAMDDSLLVRRFEGLGDLSRDGQRFVERDGAFARYAARASSPSTSSSTSAVRPSASSRP